MRGLRTCRSHPPHLQDAGFAVEGPSGGPSHHGAGRALLRRPLRTPPSTDRWWTSMTSGPVIPIGPGAEGASEAPGCHRRHRSRGSRRGGPSGASTPSPRSGMPCTASDSDEDAAAEIGFFFSERVPGSGGVSPRETGGEAEPPLSGHTGSLTEEVCPPVFSGSMLRLDLCRAGQSPDHRSGSRHPDRCRTLVRTGLRFDRSGFGAV